MIAAFLLVDCDYFQDAFVSLRNSAVFEQCSQTFFRLVT